MPSKQSNGIIYSAVIITWIVVFFLAHLDVGAGSTHWVVTADGRVQAQADSIFNLQCPYDVMVLLNQEKRRDLADAIRMELLSQDTTENPDEKDTEFEKEFYATDPSCFAAGKPLIEFDFYSGFILTHEDKGLSTEEYMPVSEYMEHETIPHKHPTCSDYVALDFTANVFDDLEDILERHNLTSREETELKSFMPMAEDLEKFSSFVASKLEKNSTSWIYYNLASFYWRVKGNSLKSIECLRRSLHFSPREFKDIALVGLSSILHRSHRSSEAAIVLLQALENSEIFKGIHFALGNIYVVLGEFNKSVICYENALQVNKGHKEAWLRKNAVLCHLKLGHILEAKHRSLQKTLDHLKEYKARHETWQILHRKMQSEQLHSEGKMKQANFYRDHLTRVQDFTKEPRLSPLDLHLIATRPTVEKPLNDADDDAMKATRPQDVREKLSHEKPKKRDDDDDDDVGFKDIREFFVESPLDHSNIFNHINEGLHEVPYPSPKLDLLYLADDWPSEGECVRNVQHFPSWSEFETVFLSLQKKGFDIAHLLGPGQGIEEGYPHPFPWYPPLCTPPPSPSSSSDIPDGPETYDHIAAVRDRASLRVKLEDSAMKEVLIKQIMQDDKQEITIEEIGQRILTALKSNTGPPWILYNLAGLFWRVSGNPLNSIECIRRALNSVPNDLRDVPTVNLASVLYRVGRVKDAIKVMKDALAINYFEPDSLFFMGNLFAAVGNISGAINYYHDALELDPTHDAALKNLRIVLCLKKFHLNHQTLAGQSTTPTSEGGASQGKNGEDPNDINKDKCSKIPMERKIPFHVYDRHGDGHFCAIPFSGEHKTSNGSPKDAHENKDDFFLRCEKMEGTNIHKIPIDLLHTLSAQQGSPCNSECLHLHNIRSFQQHKYYPQRPIIVDLDDKFSSAELCDLACQRVYRPICGSNGVTYGNLCELDSENCLLKSNVQAMYEGECSDSNPDKIEDDCIFACEHNYAPICGSDGITYTNPCAMKALNCMNNKPDVEIMYEGECSKNDDESSDDLDCIKACQLNWDPVCASSGTTFSNLCEFESFRCLTKSVEQIIHTGEC